MREQKCVGIMAMPHTAHAPLATWQGRGPWLSRTAEARSMAARRKKVVCGSHAWNQPALARATAVSRGQKGQEQGRGHGQVLLASRGAGLTARTFAYMHQPG